MTKSERKQKQNRKNYDSTNLILATSTISHGVDEDSFNIMYFFGMPNNNAEYIQAYSRSIFGSAVCCFQ